MGVFSELGRLGNVFLSVKQKTVFNTGSNAGLQVLAACLFLSLPYCAATKAFT